MSTDKNAAEALFFKGNREMADARLAEAETCFRKAISLQADFAPAIANLGLVREKCGALDEAKIYYRRAIALWPDGVQIYLNLGVLLMKEKQFADAESILRQAVQLAPDAPAAWSNLGVLLAGLKRENEAEQCYRAALALDPAYRKAQFNLSYILLRQGRLEEGWTALEARAAYAPLATYFDCPRWRGEDLRGKKIMIAFEGGHGDMLQFCRYAGALKILGARHVAVLCDPALLTLLATLTGVDAVYSHLEPAPTAGWDFWSLPMSLPLCCGTRLATIPAAIPYLAVDPFKAAAWDARFAAAAGPGLRVGVAWHGNRLFENDGERSLPSLAALESLATVDGVALIDMQKDGGDGDAEVPPYIALAAGDAFADFSDTAAAIAGLDLLISVDTAVVHLAGALGTPCWVLLPDYCADWRWMSGRSDTPWYPDTMRLFRQGADGMWPPVVAAVREALGLLQAESVGKTASAPPPASPRR